MPPQGLSAKILNKRNLSILAIVLFSMAVGGAALSKAGTRPAFCANCHIIKPYYQSWSQESLLDHKHAQQDITCLECHQHSMFHKMQQGFNYVTGNYDTPLESNLGQRDFCFQCHREHGEAASWDEIKSATDFKGYNPHDSHEGEQQCGLCHKMHQQSRFTCGQCHSATWLFNLDQSSWGI